MNKFKVGQRYVWSDWFSGGRTHYTVSGREENKLVLACVAHELDGVHERTETFDILMDEEGNERILMCEYRDHKGFLYADASDCTEKLRAFLEKYDDWNAKMVVNNDDLRIIVADTVAAVYERKDLLDKKVVSFGFYDNELTVRISSSEVR